ncbi:6-phosphofructokinase 5, chloroplastic [Tetrabaena socialis]|uniref:6-phosphofructokinase 5, chloroplastic n=1 Tax=Tetrabaena socialis TaxID=47790 RepID=A0A2J7ZS23_9CHLO|nr:6-phosphofructokinase 5, chloroplastic [Tetrabaena socialis]|eukprot:PNH03063.1 6-phosphofructokinase 5, chloroplastic [Tetrabaena socialis]
MARPRFSSGVCRGAPAADLSNYVIESVHFGDDTVLECPDLRDKLAVRRSPFVAHNNFGGGFVSDSDKVALNSMRFASAESVEASSARKGVGLVKLMGRQSGFIAMQASMASGVVDACLIPEVPFQLDGEHGLLRYLEGVIKAKGHCVVCIAEGAGQDLLEDGGSLGTDASGNPILNDIGAFLKDKMKAYFKDADIKYIDPSYMIRSVPTTSNDRIYCKILAHNAVHAAFAGYTGITVGLVNTHYVYLPIPVIIQAPRKVDPRGKAWNRLRTSIGQPSFQDSPSPTSRA